MNYDISWLIAFIAFIGIELVTMGLTSVWFGLGALVALVASLLGAPLYVQLILFVVVSTVVLVFVRPFALKYVNQNPEKTNVEAMAGKTGKVIVQINNIEGTGNILVEGLEWTARTEDDSILNVGDLVTVVRVEGVKAIVKKKEEHRKSEK